MANQELNDGETGEVILNKINSNFSELYGDKDKAVTIADANVTTGQGELTIWTGTQEEFDLLTPPAGQISVIV